MGDPEKIPGPLDCWVDDGGHVEISGDFSCLDRTEAKQFAKKLQELADSFKAEKCDECGAVAVGGDPAEHRSHWCYADEAYEQARDRRDNGPWESWSGG